jgi:hypothetical protein
MWRPTSLLALTVLAGCQGGEPTGARQAGSTSALGSTSGSSTSGDAGRAAPSSHAVEPGSSAREARFHSHGCAFRVSLSPEPARALVGEPVRLVVEVASDCAEPRSIMDGGDSRNPLGRANSYQVRLRTEAGAELASRRLHDFGGFVRGEPVRAGAPFRKRLLLAHWVTPEVPGRYVVAVDKRFQVRPADWRSERDGEGHAVVVEAPLELVAGSPEALGAVADALALAALEPPLQGGPSLEPRERAREALEALLVLVHPRVTPHVGKEPAAKVLGERGLPLAVLSTSSTEASLAALERELARASSARAPEWLEARLALARMLVSHASPRSAEALWALRSDPQEGVRLEVARGTFEKRPAAARERLDELARDGSPAVRALASKLRAKL